MTIIQKEEPELKMENEESENERLRREIKEIEMQVAEE